MCGIAGIATYQRELSRAALARMTDALALRGPDDCGINYFASTQTQVGFGHRRLSILDLSQLGHQPMHDAESGNWLVHNGEIYNFQEIKAALEREGVSFRSKTDTEVILQAYAKWGTACVERFRGIFAFCIWDASKQLLFAARDRLGVKPFYYSIQENQFLFSSEIRSLVRSELITRRLSEQGLASFLAFGAVSEPHTIFANVFMLPAGHSLIWDRGNLSIRKYWEVPFHPEDTSKTARAVTDEQFIHQVKDALHEALRFEMVSDVPVGIFLSGGVDSSALVALLHESGHRDLHTFAVGFHEQAFDDSQYSRFVASRFNTHHQELRLTPQSCLDALPEAMAAMDQPSVDGINTYIVSRETRRAGIKVALSGLGADEIFAGYSTFVDVPRMMRAQAIGQHVPQSLRSAVAKGVKSFAGPRGRKLANFIGGDSALFHPYALTRALFLPEEHWKLLGRRDVNGYDSFQKVLQSAPLSDEINLISQLELRHYMLNIILRDTDVMSMAHGLETRVPFLDCKLVEYLAGIPGPRKLSGGILKYALKRSLDGLLPTDFLRRKKRGFTFPFAHWMKKELRQEIERTLFRPNAPIHDVLDRAAVKQVWDDFLDDRLSWSRPWALYSFASWMESQYVQ